VKIEGTLRQGMVNGMWWMLLFAWKPKALPEDNSFWVYGTTITVSGGRYSTTMTLQKLQEQTIHNKLARVLISLQ
jgi:hypothetical protein